MPRIGPHDEHLIRRAIKRGAEGIVSSVFKAGVFGPEALTPNDKFVKDKTENVPELFRVSGGARMQ